MLSMPAPVLEEEKSTLKLIESLGNVTTVYLILPLYAWQDTEFCIYPTISSSLFFLHMRWGYVVTL